MLHPTTFEQDVEEPCWRDAMATEIQALDDQNARALTSLPPRNDMGCKWVYKIKHKANGTVECFKARLVAKSYTHIEGLDYTNTFASVAKMTIVRYLLALASIHNWHLHQLDATNAFLHGYLDGEVYMSLSPASIDRGETSGSSIEHVTIWTQASLLKGFPSYPHLSSTSGALNLRQTIHYLHFIKGISLP